MSNNVLNNFISLVKNEINSHHMANSRAASQKAWGLNLSAEEAELANSSYNKIEDSVVTALGALISQEDFQAKNFDFTTAQKNAAKLVAPLIQDPKLYSERISNLKSDYGYNNYPSVSAESMGVTDIVNPSSLQALLAANVAQEAYDGQKLNNAIYFSIAYNLGAARQDNFGEAFFPTVTIDPTQEGCAVSIEYTSLYNEFSRSIKGDPDASKLNRIPVVKAIYDNSIFGTDRNQLIPVYRDSVNKEQFVSTEQYVDSSTGTSITTAPLAFGKAISLLGISQTDDMIAKGTMDNTDALDRTIVLKNVYYSLSDGTNTDTFKFDASIFPYPNFVYNPQDHHKDMILNFRTDSLSINLTEIKTSKGAVAQSLATLAASYANYKVKFEVVIKGDANTFEGDIEVYGAAMKMVEVLNGSDEVVATTDAAYIAIKAVMDTVTLLGYTVDAYRTNSNIRTRGRLVTNDIYAQRYNVPLRSGITALFPVNNNNGLDNDAGTLTSQVTLAGVFTSCYAVKKLTEFESAMNQAKVNGTLSSMEFEGVSRFLVNPWFNQTAFDLSTVIDSTQSSFRDSDIREGLRLKIRQEVLEMYVGSNYGAAFELLRGTMGGKVGIIIGTDPILKNILCKDDSVFMLGENLEAHVVSTLNPAIKNKIYITFGVFDSQDRNAAPDPLNFGNHFWAPTAVFEVTKTTSNSVSRELHNQPRFLHVIHLPILSVFHVSNVQNVYNKININIKTV